LPGAAARHIIRNEMTPRREIHGYAEIALPVPVDGTFTYMIPEEIREAIAPGCRVMVPFGRRRMTGYVISTHSDPPGGMKIRNISALVDDQPLITASLLDLAAWMSGYYAHSMGEVLRAVLPAALKGRGRIAASAAGDSMFPEDEHRPALTAGQQEAFEAVRASIGRGEFARYLVYGVTGSGKTEVYLRCIEEVLAAGGRAIVLIPEISLVPQTTARFRRRFGERVAVIHSRLTGPQRASIWRDAAAGRVDVVIGARSAVFVPLRDLRMIVIDEEQDSSFKQQEKPHYGAVEVAEFRARSESAVMVTGSATPSLESWYRSQKGQIERFVLPNRPGAGRLPPVEVIDMRKKRGGISEKLLDALDVCVSAGRQAIVLINRRGFANYLQCPKCGWIGRCPNCSISLTWHSSGRRLVCHYCGYSGGTPEKCPECGSYGFVRLGGGTQKIESDLANLLPGVRILRMDLDTTAGKSGHSDILEKFASGGADILLGTQMVAKGHHYPNVTVVGVLSADAGLNFPDFRAAERTFQLLSQAAGRTGRGGEGGKVYIQTYTPEHFIFDYIVRHDYPGFAGRELASREQFAYPPAGRLILLTVSARTRDTAMKGGESVAGAAAASGTVEESGILGPVPAMIERLRGMYRVQVLVRADIGPDGKKALVGACREALSGMRGAALQWDVDPLDIF
jgi:primosomal protein N' (replication factor Y)